MHEIKRLKEKHLHMLELKAEGFSNKEIAELLGVTRETVSCVSRSPIFQGELNRVIAERRQNGGLTGLNGEGESYASKARSILEQTAQKAANVQVDLLESDDDSVKLRASGSILDRVLGKADSVAESSVNVTVDAEQAQLILVAIQETTGEKVQPPTDGKTAEGTQDQHEAVRENGSLGQSERRLSSQDQDAREVKTLPYPRPSILEDVLKNVKRA